MNVITNSLSSQPIATQQFIYQYLFANNYSQESVAFVDEWIDYIEQNNNQVLTQEFQNILNLLINQPVVVSPNISISNMTTRGAFRQY